MKYLSLMSFDQNDRYFQIILYKHMAIWHGKYGMVCQFFSSEKNIIQKKKKTSIELLKFPYPSIMHLIWNRQSITMVFYNSTQIKYLYIPNQK